MEKERRPGRQQQRLAGRAAVAVQTRARVCVCIRACDTFYAHCTQLRVEVWWADVRAGERKSRAEECYMSRAREMWTHCQRASRELRKFKYIRSCTFIEQFIVVMRFFVSGSQKERSRMTRSIR